MKIKNWQKFQHFKDRCPPWIKLYRDIMDQRDINTISDRSFRVLVYLWLMASEDVEKQGNLPPFPDIAYRLRMTENKLTEVLRELTPWVKQDDIGMISEHHQGDEPEGEAYEPEGDGETEDKKPLPPEALRLSGVMADLVFENLPTTKALLGAKRAKTIAAWAGDIDKLNRIDDYTWNQIGWIIQWSQQDHFWKQQIRSGVKLRKQFETLVIKVKASKEPRPSESGVLSARDIAEMARDAEDEEIREAESNCGSQGSVP